jgi:hypothetical protein
MDTRRWEQVGAAAGIAFVVLQLVAQGFIQTGGPEPPFNAAAPEIVDFFTTRDRRLYGLGDYLSTLSLIPFVWFLGALWARLRRAESEPAWLSVVALASGLVTAAQLVTGGGWTLAMARIDAGLDPELTRLLFDQGNLGFANIWVSLASMLLATGVVSIGTQALPRWLGWAALVIAAGLVIARAFWVGSSIVFAPYAVFWLWMIVASIVMIRRAGAAQPTG